MTAAHARWRAVSPREISAAVATTMRTMRGMVLLRQRERRTRHRHCRRAGSGRVEHRRRDRRHAGRRLLDTDRVADPTHLGQRALEATSGT